MVTPTAALPSPGITATRWPLFRHPLPAYGCALGLTVIAFLIRWICDASFGNSARMLFFLLAAALSAFLFGRGPGIFATVVGTMMGNYFFFLPRYTFHFQTRSATVTFILAVIEGIIISICAGYLHRALRMRDAAEVELRHLYEAERRAHEAAEELHRTKDYFLAVLSHELRGPLSAISYCVTDRLKDASIPEDLRADFALIDRNAHMQSRLIGDLLDLTRLTRGKLEIELRPLDLHLLLAEAVRTAGIDRQLVGPTPTLHLKAQETRIQGDRDRLLQVFWNILRNAAKFTPPDGRIEIETSNPAPGRIAVRVQDNGVGLTAESLERIFHPFEQAGHETNKKHGGLGLGLAIARGIVELHDGTLIGESAGLGHGTSFTIDLPTLNRDTPPASSRRSGVDRSPQSSASRPPSVGVA
ncbi:MAG: ATP-binding protein [Chthoniobacter sp.]